MLGCALLQDLGAATDGPRCGELAAFCVSPAYRGSGRGDALLDYVEQSARDQGMRRLVLLTTRTADWCAPGWPPCSCPAGCSPVLLHPAHAAGFSSGILRQRAPHT